MTELENRNVDYENKENKCELVARLRKNIGEETQKEIKGIYHNRFIFYFFSRN